MTDAELNDIDIEGEEDDMELLDVLKSKKTKKKKKAKKTKTELAATTQATNQVEEFDLNKVEGHEEFEYNFLLERIEKIMAAEANDSEDEEEKD